jgi:hypothetical protein
VTEQDSRRAIEAVFRIESARLIASLMRLVRDVGLATKAELRAADRGHRGDEDMALGAGRAQDALDRTRRPRDRNGSFTSSLTGHWSRRRNWQEYCAYPLNGYIVRRRTLQMTERQKLGVAAWIGIGILLGTLAGAAADNVGGGFAVGAVLGLAFGYAYYRKVRA